MKPRRASELRCLSVCFLISPTSAKGTDLPDTTQAFAAFAHQRVVAEDFDAAGLEFDQFAEDVGRPVEQGAGQHGTLDALAGRIGLAFVARPCFSQAGAGNVQAMLGVIEEASGQGLDQAPLGFQGIGGYRIGLDPVAFVQHAFLTIDDSAGAFLRDFHVGRAGC